MSKILCILDGFGISPGSPNNVLSLSKLPNFKSILEKYYWYTLNADGDNVGQESGLVGNSEVGHMNLGGLKLIPQLSYQITKSGQSSFDLNKEIAPDELFDPKVFLAEKFKSGNKTVHLIGLFSTGTIHSDLRHWAGSIEAAGKSGASKIVLHILSDGRDSDRQSLVETWNYFVKTFEDRIKPFEDKIFLGSLGGRFYAMDRDKNWARVIEGLLSMFGDQLKSTLFNDSFKALLEKYNLNLEELVAKIKHSEFNTEINTSNLEKVLEMLSFYSKLSYDKGEFDEHILPQQLFYSEHQTPNISHGISKNDSIWLINFRTDRMKQLSQMLSDINQELELNLNILGMNDYCIDKEIYLDQNLVSTRSKTTVGYFPVFKNQPVKDPMAKYLSEIGKTQLHIAETEKYNHVTYFFNGGQNQKWEGEDWVVIDSNKVASHAEKPEMKAKEVTDYILENGLGKYDYIIVNYANPDMVGHTGDIEAGIISMEFLDQQLGRLIEKVELEGHEMIITADHGNIEFVGAFENHGKKLTDTEHNPNRVPLIFVSKKYNPDNLLTNIDTFEKTHEVMQLLNLKNILLEDNRLNLSENEWLATNQIPKAELPLWFAGFCLVNL